MIKVVMTSTNQAKPPRIKNFRSIALRSSWYERLFKSWLRSQFS
jgi:hypothetical protein